MKYAIVDLGSNSIRMCIYDQTDGNLKRIISQKELIGLIEYTKHGILLENGITRILETLISFLDTAQLIGTDHFCCFATASLRNIENAQEVIQKVKKETGIAINLISGEEEARLDFLGACGNLDFDDGIIIDMGGGSTEIIRFKKKVIQNLISLPFGSLFLYKKYVKKIMPNKKQTQRIKDFVVKQLSDIAWLPNSCSKVCLVGGTARAIARIHQEIFLRQKENLQGYTFDAKDIKLLFDAIELSKNDGIKFITRVSPERLHTIIPGLIAFSKIIKLSGCDTITISKNGVREGYLGEYLLNK